MDCTHKDIQDLLTFIKGQGTKGNKCQLMFKIMYTSRKRGQRFRLSNLKGELEQGNLDCAHWSGAEGVGSYRSPAWPQESKNTRIWAVQSQRTQKMAVQGSARRTLLLTSLDSVGPG